MTTISIGVGDIIGVHTSCGVIIISDVESTINQSKPKTVIIDHTTENNVEYVKLENPCMATTKLFDDIDIANVEVDSDTNLAKIDMKNGESITVSADKLYTRIKDLLKYVTFLSNKLNND